MNLWRDERMREETEKKGILCRKRWDSPYQEVTDLYMTIGHLHRNVLERRLNRTGVYRSQHQLLMCIADNPKVSQKQLARVHHVSAATVAVSLKKLENGGYISRVVDQSDNRYNQICITEKGQAIVDKSISCFHNVEQKMFEGFSREEIGCLKGYLVRIRKNLEAMAEEKREEERN